MVTAETRDRDRVDNGRGPASAVGSGVGVGDAVGSGVGVGTTSTCSHPLVRSAASTRALSVAGAAVGVVDLAVDAVELVVPVAAAQHVRAGPAGQHVGARPAVELLCAVRADQDVVRRAAAEHLDVGLHVALEQQRAVVGLAVERDPRRTR